MEVKMNKEIRDYQESMFWGLSFRQCLFSVLAILAALGIYFLTRKYAGEQVTGWLCVLGAAPFAACGFFRYHGMTAEQFSIVKNADQILVMGDGRIAESGTHEELLAKGGKYAAMWNAEQKISA